MTQGDSAQGSGVSLMQRRGKTPPSGPQPAEQVVQKAAPGPADNTTTPDHPGDPALDARRGAGVLSNVKAVLSPSRRKNNRSAAGAAVKPSILPRAKWPANAAKPGAGSLRQKVLMALIPILVAGLILLVKNPLKPRPAAAANTTKSETTAAAQAPAADTTIDWQVPPEYQQNSRDPMGPPAHQLQPHTPKDTTPPAETQPVISVMGILYSKERPAAIIGTQIVYEGQQVDGTTVVKIERDSVEFERNGRTWKQTVAR